MRSVSYLIAILTTLLAGGCERGPSGRVDARKSHDVRYRCVIRGGQIVALPPSVTASHQRWDSPGMAHLVETYPAIHDHPNDVQKAITICRWLRARIKLGGEAFKYPLYVPAMLKRLDAMGKGYTMTCGPASLILTSLCLARGLEARVAFAYSLAQPELKSHTFAEVWSDEKQKWFVADPMYGMVWLSEEGDPAGVLELQGEYVRAGADFGEFVHQPQFPDGPLGGECARSFQRDYRATFFDLIAIATDNTFTDPEFALRPGKFLAKFADRLIAYPVDATKAASHAEWQHLVERHRVSVTDDRSLLAWRPNQIEAEVRARRPREVEIDVRHNIHNLLRIEWQQEGADQWQALAGSTLVLPAQPPASFLIRGVTRLGGTTKAFQVVIEPR